MSLHRSLKTKPGALNLHRNVLTRTERITFLSERGRFDWEQASPLGLIKIANRKAKVAKKKAAEAEGAEAGAEGAAAPAAAPAAAAPAADKKAADKKGDKGADKKGGKK